jgi:HAD superfamily hydrolase (TIGR01509 family)
MHDDTQSPVAPLAAFACLWDMDGTLVDTSTQHYDAWRATCLAHGRDLTREEFFATFGRRNEETIPLLFGASTPPERIRAIAAEKELAYREAAGAGVDLLPGCAALLAALRSAGWLQAIASSAPRANVDLIARLTHTAATFAAIVAGEDVRNGKPAPDVFLAAAAHLGVPSSRCIVLEDAPVGIRAAKAAGMRAVGVVFRSHHTAADLRAAGADLIADDMRQVTVAALEELLR